MKEAERKFSTRWQPEVKSQKKKRKYIFTMILVSHLILIQNLAT